jgi:hypothetical protein
MYSSSTPGLPEIPDIQSISWFGPATKPSSDIVKCQSTLPAAVCGSGWGVVFMHGETAPGGGTRRAATPGATVDQGIQPLAWTSR